MQSAAKVRNPPLVSSAALQWNSEFPYERIESLGGALPDRFGYRSCG
jgi:hypothetical protein